MSNYINYRPLDEEELIRIANQRVAPSYDEQIAAYQRQAAKQEAAYRQSLEGLDPAYAKLGRQVERQFELKRQDVSDAAMARGFGRSSYVTDVIGQTHDQQYAQLEELAARKQQEADGIAGKIEALYDDLMENQSRLSTAKQNKILSTIDQLRLEQSAREMEVMQYNADMAMRERQLEQQWRQFEAQMAMNRDQMAADSQAREWQMQMEREKFNYARESDAYAREAAAAAAAAKAEAERIKAMMQAAKSSGGGSSKGSSSGGSSAKKKPSVGGSFAGIRV